MDRRLKNANGIIIKIFSNISVHTHENKFSKKFSHETMYRHCFVLYRIKYWGQKRSKKNYVTIYNKLKFNNVCVL